MKDKIDNVKIQANNVLNELFRTREDSIYNFTDNERKLLSKKSKDYSNIYIAIDNIPDGFVETINGIKTSIENYIETFNEIQGIENEKFYKEGFSYAIQLILECINNKHEL